MLVPAVPFALGRYDHCSCKQIIHREVQAPRARGSLRADPASPEGSHPHLAAAAVPWLIALWVNIDQQLLAKQADRPCLDSTQANKTSLAKVVHCQYLPQAADSVCYCSSSLAGTLNSMHQPCTEQAALPRKEPPKAYLSLGCITLAKQTPWALFRKHCGRSV